jgi:hypothetical protein
MSNQSGGISNAASHVGALTAWVVAGLIAGDLMIWRRIALLCHESELAKPALDKPLITSHMMESRTVLHLAPDELDCLIPEFMPTPWSLRCRNSIRHEIEDPGYCKSNHLNAEMRDMGPLGASC